MVFAQISIYFRLKKEHFAQFCLSTFPTASMFRPQCKFVKTPFYIENIASRPGPVLYIWRTWAEWNSLPGDAIVILMTSAFVCVQWCILPFFFFYYGLQQPLLRQVIVWSANARFHKLCVVPFKPSASCRGGRVRVMLAYGHMALWQIVEPSVVYWWHEAPLAAFIHTALHSQLTALLLKTVNIAVWNNLNMMRKCYNVWNS